MMRMALYGILCCCSKIISYLPTSSQGHFPLVYCVLSEISLLGANPASGPPQVYGVPAANAHVMAGLSIVASTTLQLQSLAVVPPEREKICCGSGARAAFQT
jgi:hypothetical protein